MKALLSFNLCLITLFHFPFFFRKRTEQTVGVSQMYDNFPLLVFPTALQTDEQLGYVSKILETRAA